MVAEFKSLNKNPGLEALSNLTGLTFLRLESPEKQLKGHLGSCFLSKQERNPF